MRYVLQFFALAATVAIVPACGLTEVHETVHRTVASVSAPAVHVSNPLGAVRIDASDKPFIDIVAVKDAHSTDDLRHININVKSSGNDVTISTVNDGTSSMGSGVKYTITVPAGASLDIDNGTGGIRINGVRGDVAARSTTGGIEADLGTVGRNRKIDMHVTTGGIDVKIARNSGATLDMHAAIGGVTNDFGSDRIGDGSARIHLETSVGGIALRSSENS